MVSLIGCESFPFSSSTYTLIEVTDRVTGAPITGAEIVTGSATFFRGEAQFDSVMVGPTDEAGRSYMPVGRMGGAPFDVVLSISIESGERRETIDVMNRTGESVSRGLFTLEVINADAPPPPLPALRAIEGTRPVQMEMGYFGVVGVCSVAGDEVVWEIICPVEPFYLDHISVGSMPKGCFDNTWLRTTRGMIPMSCPVSTAGLPQDGFVPYATTPLESELSSSDPYCLDSTGAATTCRMD